MRRVLTNVLGLGALAMLAGCGVNPLPQPVDPNARPGMPVAPPQFEIQQRSMVDVALRLATPQVRQFMYLFREINAFRVANGVPALTSETGMIRAAGNHSRDMATRNYFSHTSLEGTSAADRMRAAGVTFTSWAENIGYQSPPEPTAAARMLEAWKNSPGHRANMLNPAFRRTGLFPYQRASDGYWYYTQVFAN